MRVVGIIEIIGGTLASATAAFALVTQNANMATKLIFAVLLLVSIASVFAGALLLRSHRLGMGLSMMIQVIQVPAFSLGNMVYYLGLGLFLAFGLDAPQFSSSGAHLSLYFQYGLGTDFLIRVGEPVQERYLAINAVALVLLALLWQPRKAIPGVRTAA